MIPAFAGSNPAAPARSHAGNSAIIGASSSGLRHWILIPAFAGSNPAAPANASKGQKLAMSDFKIFTGNANLPLAEEVAQELGVPLGKALVGCFADGETRVELQENIRGKDVFILQSTNTPANQHIMEALVISDACHRASANSITLVSPYFGYARQERKSASRTPITAKLVAGLYESAGITRILALELHNSAIQGFFRIPVDHLFAKPVLADFLQKQAITDLTIVSPDAGGVERARALAKHLKAKLAIIDKRRTEPNHSSVIHLIGDVTSQNCVIVDDIVDTGNSLVQAAEALKANGAKEVSAVITHPVLSGQAVEKIDDSVLTSVLVTNTIALSSAAIDSTKIKQISVAKLLSAAIKRIESNDSISSLFI